MPDLLPDVGLIGLAQSGKDTAATRLVETHGFTRVAFADPVRELALAVDPIVGVEAGLDFLGLPPAGVRLSAAVRRLGWEGAKQHPEVRRLLDAFGMKVREVVGDDSWLDLGLAAADRFAPAVFTDVRLENEAQAIADRGGLLVRVVRPGVSRLDLPSEGRLADWPVDAVLPNDRGVRDLHAAVDTLVVAIRRHALPSAEEATE